jgi:hypothetical protein
MMTAQLANNAVVVFSARANLLLGQQNAQTCFLGSSARFFKAA